MRMQLVVAMVLCLAVVHPLCAADPPGLQAGEARVCFVDFRMPIERPITADSIERRGCNNAIDARRFLAMLKPMSPAWPFVEQAVRAKVSLPDGRVYLVDQQGAVRSGNQTFLLSPIVFSESLRHVP